VPLMFLSEPGELKQNLKNIATTLIKNLENCVQMAKGKRGKMAENYIENLEEIISVISKYRDDENCDLHPQKIGSVFVAVGNIFQKIDANETATTTGSVAECYGG